MSSTQARSDAGIDSPRAATVDMKLEVVVIPVSDVDRARRFYDGLGWRLDADIAAGDDFRIVQLTSPGSGCSIQFGTNLTSAAPGSAQGLYLIVSDIEAARDALVARGVGRGRGVPRGRAGRALPRRRPRRRAGARSQHLRVVRRVQRPRRERLAAAGDHRPASRSCRSQRDDVQLRRRSGAGRSSAPRRRTASTRSGSGRQIRTGPPGTPSTWCGSRPERSCRHEQRLRRDRDRRRLAGRALRRRIGRGRPARRTRRARARRRRVLLLGLHSVQDAAAPGRGRACRARRDGDRRGRRRGGARLARLDGLELLRQRPGALAGRPGQSPCCAAPAGSPERGWSRSMACATRPTTSSSRPAPTRSCRRFPVCRGSTASGRIVR